jgi:hypothetical protein
MDAIYILILVAGYVVMHALVLALMRLGEKR